MNVIQPKEFDSSVFNLISGEWLLLAAEKDGVTNAMTCSWGGMGVLWNKNVAFIFVRHARHTYEFMENSDTFSLSIFDDPNHELLKYFGTVSGRDEDKIAKAGLTIEKRQDTPCFSQARLTFTCKKLYNQQLLAENFVDTTIIEKFYGDNDFHMMYVGEILEITEK